MNFNRGQNVIYNAQSGKAYPAAVLEIRRDLNRGFTASPHSLHYLIEITSYGISKKILCTENELRCYQEHSAIKTAVPFPKKNAPETVRKNKIRNI